MKRLLLPLNLQFFSEEPPAEPNKPTDNPQDPSEPVITMTQAEFDRKLGERLAREKAKTDKAVQDAKDEAERQKLAEEGKFKALYEAEKQAREKVEQERAAERLLSTKQSLLLDAGYPADKLADLLDFVTGDDEESAKASVEKLTKVAPPKAAPVDPAISGGGRQQPEQKDGTELGKAMYERIKNKIR